MSINTTPQGTSTVARIYPVLTGVTALAVAAQILVAFLGIGLSTHRLLGVVVGLLVLTEVLVARAGRLPRDTMRLTYALLVVTVLQPVWIALGTRVDAFNAVHGFTAFVVLALALVLALDSD